MKKSPEPDPIEKARDYARRAVREVYPKSQEVPKSTSKMYEFDAIIIDDESCDIEEIAIMYDEESDTFALVDHVRLNEELIHEAEKETAIADLLQQIEWKVMLLSMQCETSVEVTAAWAAIVDTTSASMTNRLHEINSE